MSKDTDQTEVIRRLVEEDSLRRHEAATPPTEGSSEDSSEQPPNGAVGVIGGSEAIPVASLAGALAEMIEGSGSAEQAEPNDLQLTMAVPFKAESRLQPRVGEEVGRLRARGRPDIVIKSNPGRGILWLERDGDTKRYVLFTNDLFASWAKAIGVAATGGQVVGGQ